MNIVTRSWDIGNIDAIILEIDVWDNEITSNVQLVLDLNEQVFFPWSDQFLGIAFLGQLYIVTPDQGGWDCLVALPDD